MANQDDVRHPVCAIRKICSFVGKKFIPLGSWCKFPLTNELIWP